MELLTHPFSIGLGVGLLVAAALWFNGWAKRRSLVAEVKRLREHLHTQMEINSRGNEDTRKTLDALKEQNENLRISNATLKNKPGRAELHTLVVYDKALHLMQARVPGFAPAWEAVVNDAEREVEKADRGLVPMIRKIFRPSLNKTADGGELGDTDDRTAVLRNELQDGRIKERES